jgi:hypothetical protein
MDRLPWRPTVPRPPGPANSRLLGLATCCLTPLLQQQHIALASAGARIASLDDLRCHAVAADITFPQQPHTDQKSTLQTRDTRQTHVIPGRVPIKGIE